MGEVENNLQLKEIKSVSEVDSIAKVRRRRRKIKRNQTIVKQLSSNLSVQEMVAERGSLRFEEGKKKRELKN